LDLVREVKARDGLTVFAWCLMTNHYLCWAQHNDERFIHRGRLGSWFADAWTNLWPSPLARGASAMMDRTSLDWAALQTVSSCYADSMVLVWCGGGWSWLFVWSWSQRRGPAVVARELGTGFDRQRWTDWASRSAQHSRSL